MNRYLGNGRPYTVSETAVAQACTGTRTDEKAVKMSDFANETSGPFWPLALLPFTRRGRAALKGIFFDGVPMVLGTEEPAEVVIEVGVKCYNCDGTAFKNGQCVKCGVVCNTIVKCAVCGQDQALPDYRPFFHNCVKCGKRWVAE